MQLSADINLDKEAFLDLERQASEPYSCFAYRDADEGDMIRRWLFERRLCEFSPPFGRVLVDEGRVIAMLAWLPAGDLVRCRLLASVAISRLDYFQRNKKLRQRIRLASTTLIRPEDGDFYIARIAVAKTLERRGVGSYLLAQCEAKARELGCRRLVLEVDPHNEPAVSLYRKGSFQDGGLHSTTDPDTGRSLEYLHMARILHS